MNVTSLKSTIWIEAQIEVGIGHPLIHTGRNLRRRQLPESGTDHHPVILIHRVPDGHGDCLQGWLQEFTSVPIMLRFYHRLLTGILDSKPSPLGQ